LCRRFTWKPGSLFIALNRARTRAWLFKILFHRLHHLRRRLIKASKLEGFANPADQDNLMAEPQVLQEIRDDDILLALAKVPPDFREVVLMADVQEFSYK
jgi:RNA polymerase sigma-70 factor, ECF subfamily